jgi:hypothetical protein
VNLKVKFEGLVTAVAAAGIGLANRYRRISLGNGRDKYSEGENCKQNVFHVQQFASRNQASKQNSKLFLLSEKSSLKSPEPRALELYFVIPSRVNLTFSFRRIATINPNRASSLGSYPGPTLDLPVWCSVFRTETNCSAKEAGQTRQEIKKPPDLTPAASILHDY